jgi:hypothetical protein
MFTSALFTATQGLTSVVQEANGAEGRGDEMRRGVSVVKNAATDGAESMPQEGSIILCNLAVA